MVTEEKPTLPQLTPLVRGIYQRHTGGCCLHILIDDGNIENAHAQFCLDEARRQEHADCTAAAELLLKMTKTQRRKAARFER